MRSRLSRDIRRQVLRDFGGVCAVCASPIVEVHHIKPKAEGGSDELGNLLALCARCHDVVTYTPNVFNVQAQLTLRNRAKRVLTSLDMVFKLLSSNEVNLAIREYYNSKLQEDLVTCGWYRRGVEILSQLLRQDNLGSGDLCRLTVSLAEMNFWEGKHRQAYGLLNKAGELLSEQDRHVRAQYHSIRGRVLNYLADDELLVDVGQKVDQREALEEYEKSSDYAQGEDEIATLHSNKSSALMSLGAVSDALEEAERGVVAAGNNPHGRETNLDRCASILRAEGDYDNALVAVEQSLLLSIDTAYLRGISYRMRSIGQSMLFLGEYRDAVFALNCSRLIGDMFGDPNTEWIASLELTLRQTIGEARYERIRWEIAQDFRKFLGSLGVNGRIA